MPRECFLGKRIFALAYGQLGLGLPVVGVLLVLQVALMEFLLVGDGPGDLRLHLDELVVHFVQRLRHQTIAPRTAARSNAMAATRTA